MFLELYAFIISAAIGGAFGGAAGVAIFKARENEMEKRRLKQYVKKEKKRLQAKKENDKKKKNKQPEKDNGLTKRIKEREGALTWAELNVSSVDESIRDNIRKKRDDVDSSYHYIRRVKEKNKDGH